MDINKIPTVVVISCIRDLPILELQAQSVCKYLDQSNPICIIVNEADSDSWFEYFNQHIRHYYNKHDLTVLTIIDDFPGEWHVFRPHRKNPWGVGWQRQQALKMMISTRLSSEAYLLLDCQNFLIKNWNAAYAGKIPYRVGDFVMPIEAWHNYAASLDLQQVPDPTQEYMSMCTPFYMHTKMIRKLIISKGGEAEFLQWFNLASTIKSEFMLYALWLEKFGGIEQYHEKTDNWIDPMLRDSRTNFEYNFNQFIDFLGVHDSHAWASVNHRSWGDMTQDQYKIICSKLAEYGLEPKFNDYRAGYVDYKI